jgi:hypothetical protein
MTALYPALKMARCQRHYVFCLLREHAPALIVAILRERTDLMKRLVDRLRISLCLYSLDLCKQQFEAINLPADFCFQMRL